MLSAEPPFLGWAVLTCQNWRWGSGSGVEWASPPLRVACCAVLVYAGSCIKRCGGAKGLYPYMLFPVTMKSGRNQKHRKRKPHPQRHPPQQQQQQRQHSQYFVRCACQTSMLQTPKRLDRTFRTKLVQNIFLSWAGFSSGDFAGLRRHARCACQTSMLQIPKRLSRAFHAKLAQRFLSKAALRFDGFEGLNFTLNIVLVKLPCFKSQKDCAEHFMPSWPKDL